MFGHITGKIFDLKGTKAIVDTHGIGFVIHSTPSYLTKLKTDQEASFWTHTAVRETSITFDYRFRSRPKIWFGYINRGQSKIN
jgi:Holliday junction resolvasome RuvABC DNA-binding subunit